MTEYYLTHVGGLEEIVAAELAERVPAAQVLGAEYGHLYLAYAGEPADLFTLRTVENVHVKVLSLHNVSPQREWLDRLQNILAEIDFSPAVAVLARLQPVPAEPTFRVTADRSGEHEYRSPEIAAAAGAGIVAGMGWRVNLTAFDIEVRVHVWEDRALIGVRLSPQSLHRRSRVVHPRVALNPTVAAAMTRLSAPQPGELVVDPMAGSGTLLTERYAYDPRVRLIGGDKFPEKIALARQNFAAFGVPASLVQWDARQLPLPDSSVDKFLVNPPWGRVMASHAINRQLYPAFLAEMERCLKPGGRIVILTSERALIRRFLRAHPQLRLLWHRRLKIAELEPSLHLIEKAG